MPIQILLDINDDFKVTGASIKDSQKDSGFVTMSKEKPTPDHPDQPPRDDNTHANPNRRVDIAYVRTGTGTCDWVKTSASWVWRCTNP